LPIQHSSTSNAQDPKSIKTEQKLQISRHSDPLEGPNHFLTSLHWDLIPNVFNIARSMLITKQVAYRYVERLFAACGRWLELDKDCFSYFRRGLAYPIHGSIFWDDLEVEVSLTIFDLLSRFKSLDKFRLHRFTITGRALPSADGFLAELETGASRRPW
jgi:hypothetical protein